MNLILNFTCLIIYYYFINWSWNWKIKYDKTLKNYDYQQVVWSPIGKQMCLQYEFTK